MIDVAVRGLPHAFRDVPAGPGQSIAIDIAGGCGGLWTLTREEQHWTLWRGEPPSATARIRLNDETAWKLLFNALRQDEPENVVDIEGQG